MDFVRMDKDQLIDEITSLKKQLQNHDHVSSSPKFSIDKLLDSIGDLLYIKDTRGQYIDCNKAFADFVGKKQDELPGCSDFDLFPQAEAELFHRSDAQLTELDTLEKRTLTDKNGQSRYYEIRKSPLKDEAGETTAVLSLCRDISHQHITQDQLRLIQFGIEKSPFSVFHIDDDSFIRYANECACESLGYSKQELLSLTILDIDPTFNLEKWKKHRQMVLSDSYSTIQTLHKKKDGTVFPVEVTINYFEYEGKIYTLSFAKDISERIESEKALREREENLKTTLNSIGDAVIATDASGKITRMNPIAELLTGWKIEDALDRDLKDIFRIVHSNSGELVQNPVEKVLKSDKIEGLANDTVLISKDGTELQISDSGAPIHDKDGTIIGIVLVFRDITAFKQVEEKLRASEQRLLQAHFIAKLGDFVWDLETDEVHWSDAMRRLLHYTKIENMNYSRVNREIHHPEDLQRVTKWLKNAIASGKRSLPPNDYRIIRKDGSVIHIHTEGRIEYKDGKPVKVFGTCVDITNRVEAEQKTREANQRFELASKATKEGIWEWNFRNKTGWWNNTMFSMLGYGRNQIIPNLEAWFEKIHPEDRDDVHTSFFKAMNSKTNQWNEEFRYLRGNKAPGYAFGSCLITRDKKGKAEKIICSMQDITQQKMNETALRVSEARFKALIEQAPDAIFLADLDGHFIEVNTAAEQLLGYTREELLTRKIIDLNVSFDTKEKIQTFYKKLQTNQTITAEGQHRRKGGSTIPTETNLGLIEIGDTKYILAFIRNISERKQTEEKLQQNQNRLELALKGADLGLWDWDIESGYVIWNERGAEMLGYKLEEINQTYLGWKEKVHPDDLQFAVKKLNEHIAGKSSFYEMEHRMRAKNGEYRWILARGKVIHRDKNGKALRAAGTQLDITERKQFEHALREAEEKIRFIIEHSSNLFFSHTTDNVLTYVSPQSQHFLGCDPDEARSRWTEFTSDNPINKIAEKRTMDAIKTGKIQPAYKIELKTKDNRIIWAEVHEAPVVENGKTISIVGALTDISDRVKAEEALIESEEKYRALIDQSVDAIYLSANNQYELINKKFEDLFGFSCEELNNPNFDFLQIVAPKSQEKVNACMSSNSTNPGLAKSCSFTALTAAQKEIEVEAITSRIKLKNGFATQCIIRDVTKQKLLEEQLRQSQKMEAIGQLAGGVAHDFNNLLTVISGYSEILLSLPHPENIMAPLEQIQSAAERATRLTSQLLAFSRKQIINPVMLNLNSHIADQIKILGRLLGEDIQIETLFDPDLELIKADPGQIDQVIMNISVNARDAMPFGGILTIETASVTIDANYISEHPEFKSGNYTRLSISDTGVGMDRVTQTRIFEPFYTTKGRGKGTGLGLATVYGIIKQNNGFIYVYSEPQNGTTFKIYLPVIKNGVTQKVDKPISIEQLYGSEAILLVEDDDSVRDVTEATLKKFGYNVLTAASGQEALKMYNDNAEKIKMLITDVIMPEMSGRQLAVSLQTMNPMLKVLYLSGYTDDSIVRHGILDEGMEFLQKPYSLYQLAKKTRAVLDK